MFRLLGAAAFAAYLSTVRGQVSYDLQPCILSPGELNVIIGPSSTLGLVNTDGSGKCNVIYVGIDLTDVQKAEVQDYSRTFKTRIVYLEAANTANDLEVQARLKVVTPAFLPAPEGLKLTSAGAAASRVSPEDMQTNPTLNNIYVRSVVQQGATEGGVATIIAAHADGEGNELTYNVDGVNYPLVSAVEWIGEDGLEELHLWFAMGWFDMGSWGWGNYITDWGTKGIFQGERRYYLGPVVDDLLLGTNVFIYDGAENEGPLFRMSGQDLVDFGASLDSINAKYGSEVIVDFAYNGNGILEKVNSAFTLSFDDADAALLPKGQKISGNGIAPLHDPEWLSTGITGMATEFLTNLWQSDDLLASVLSDAMKTKFHWQSHTMSHLARDNLGISDCTIEDQANIEIAKLTGFYYGNENFNWYSMTSPGITGLFNEFCLSSGADQLMICYPGDNTYVGEGTVSLVADNKFHPLTTTVATNGYNGATIVPRFATFVYYNCVTPDCLVQENEYIRRIVCGCAELDPSLSTGECPLCNGDIQSFGSMANLIAWEKETTTRQILSGFRDKYMFHQANVIPTTVDGVSGKSLLQYWIEEMMTGLTSFIKLPVKTLKFDHLCENFQWHEALDNAEPLLKANKDASGVLTSVTLSSSSGSSGYIPFTVPSDMTVDVSSIDGGSSVTYGSDKTYYFATPGNTVETYKAGPVEKTAEYLDAQVVACKKLCIINEACKSFSGDVKTACKKNCKKNCKKCILKNNENKC